MTAHPSCISCGMPMREPEDHALADPGRPYCAQCCHPDGTRLSFEEVLDRMTAFLVNTRGIDASVAREAASRMLMRLRG